MTSALYLSRFGHQVTVFSNYSYGSLENTPLIENFPGFTDGISGKSLLEKIKQQTEKYGTIFKEEGIVKINSKTYNIEDDAGNNHLYDALIVATGSEARKLEIPGEFNYCAMCDGMLYKDKDVIVVGGGNTALTEAIHLSDICRNVTVLYRSKIKASNYLMGKCKQEENIFFKKGKIASFENSVAEIEAYGQIEKINIDGVFVSIGSSPNDILVRNEFGITFERNENVFMCGDCKKNQYRQAIIAAGDGAKTAIDVDNYLTFSII